MLTPEYRGHNLVFVVGSPRSGTTWLQRLLACHNSVRTGQESGLFDTYIGPQLRAWQRDMDPATSGRSAIGMGCYLREDEFLTLVKGYMLQLLEPMAGTLSERQLFLEKTPSHALFIPEIMRFLPESRVIHVLRDARDVAASLMAAGKSWGRSWAPRDARRAARMWVDHVSAVRSAAAQIPPGQFLEIRYEDLHVSAGKVLRQVADFLGLAWTPDEIESAVTQNSVSTAKAGGGTAIEIKGEYAARSGGKLVEPTGFVRKARLNAWRDELSLIDRLGVWLVARKAMAEQGYTWNIPW